MPSRRIAIVSHCYAMELPQYATFLHFQLSSLVKYRPECEFAYFVCYNNKDRPTKSVVDWFREQYTIEELPLYVVKMTLPRLGRRCIGRDTVAYSIDADVFWFTDVDHFFHAGCLDNLRKAWDNLDDDVTIAYPGEVMVHRDHWVGDACVARAKAGSQKQLFDIDLTEFVPQHHNRAIGPLQIARGEYCKKYGYLHDTEWQQQLQPDQKLFGSFQDDVAFRSHCKKHGQQQKIHVPGIYRLRHTHTSYEPPKVREDVSQ